ncbi:MAG: hypothetical protein BMS9Abin03_049 [Thermodesulfobacteriota bacterium]|nr:MAG: hypothetical protein BMS9Abin03_049 [Thermodesulfobacteriota bacterium]
MSAPSSDTKWKKRINGPFSIAATLCVVMFVSVGFGPSRESVERTTEQNKLAKVAVEDKDWRVRQATLEKLTDQALLAKVVQLGSDQAICLNLH